MVFVIIDFLWIVVNMYFYIFRWEKSKYVNGIVGNVDFEVLNFSV